MRNYDFLDAEQAKTELVASEGRIDELQAELAAKDAALAELLDAMEGVVREASRVITFEKPGAEPILMPPAITLKTLDAIRATIAKHKATP